MSSYAPGTVRVWTGAEWTYQPVDWLEMPYEIILKGGASQAVATTTTCSQTPTTLHKGGAVTVTASTTGRGGGNLDFFYRTSSGNWAKIATKAAPAAGGSVSINHYPAASGYYYAAFTGSPGYKPSSSGQTALVTVQTLTTATKTVPMSWWQAYGGDGTRISGSGSDNAVHQGYYSSSHGNRKSLIGFAPGLPSGSVVTSVVLECAGAWEHWYASTGGTVVVGSFINQANEPATWPSAKVTPNRSRKEVSAGSWSIDLSSWAATALENAAFSGITLGPGPSSSPVYYGYSDDSLDVTDFVLRVTYQAWS